eukprot:g648.t1
MILITCLFALLGLTIQLAEMRRALFAIRCHALTQLFSLVLTPVLYYALVFYPSWEVRAGILSRPFAVGMMAALCMPTTTNTSVLFAQQARGDVSVASINAAVGNLVGAVFAPVLATALINSVVQSGATRVHSDAAKTAAKLGREIVAPMVGGLCVQWAIGRWAMHGAPSGVVWRRVRRVLLAVSNAILCVMFWLVFSKAFAGKHDGMTGRGIALLVFWVVVWHLLLVALAWYCSRWVSVSPPPAAAGDGRQGACGQCGQRACGSHACSGREDAERRVAFLLVAPQKTESMAVAILAALFTGSNDIGLLTLPIVTYHSVQMVVAAVLVPRCRRMVAAATLVAEEKAPQCDAAEALLPEAERQRHQSD